MKLLRVGEHGNEIPAIIDNQNNFRNLSNILKDFTPENLNFENLDKIKKLDLNSLPLIVGNFVSSIQSSSSNSQYAHSCYGCLEPA